MSAPKVDRPHFVHPVAAFPPGLLLIENAAELPDDLEREVETRLAEIRLARARAEVSSRDYLIY